MTESPKKRTRPVPLRVNVSGAQELIRRDDPLILDVRDAASYRQSHITGAMLLHDGLLEALVKGRDFTRPLLLYCYRGNTSLDKAQLLIAAGFQKVYSLDGGYVDWSKQTSSTPVQL